MASNAKATDDEEQEQDTLLKCADLRFKLAQNPKDAATKKSLYNIFKENRMIEFYKLVWQERGWKVDEKEIAAWKAENDKKLEEIAAARKDAEENKGDTEVRDEDIKKANIITLSATKDVAIKEWESVEGLTKGRKIDAYLQILRILLAYEDDNKFRKYSKTTEDLIEKGGDWDRRNRFTIYKALAAIRIRNFKQGAELLLKSIQTFTAYEICDYKKFVFYAVCSSIPTLKRKSIKKDVIDSPEVRQVIHEIPFLKQFLNSIYECKYKEFFAATVGLMPHVRADRYLSIQANYFLRELRYTAYNQYLKSYRTVSLKSMADQFGLSRKFLDRELSDFIAAGRLSIKINAVNGVVETKRPDRKNADYQTIIMRGDHLLNRLQKLSKVITL